MNARLHQWTLILATGVLLFSGCAGPRGSGARKGVEASKDGAAIKSRSGSKTTEEADSERLIKSYAHFAAGIAHDLDSKPDQALDELWKSAEANPGYEPVVTEVARRLIRLKQPEKAIQLLNKSASLSDATGQVFVWLGLAYQQAGQLDKAITANRTAIKKMPDSLPGYQNLTQVYLQSSKTNEAFEVLNQAARQSSVSAEYLVDLMDLFGRYGRINPTRAKEVNKRQKELLDRAAKIETENPAVIQKIGDGYFALNQWEQAEKAYLKLLEEFPEMPVIRAKLAELYLRTDQKEKVTEQLEAIAKLDPTNPRTQSFLGAMALEENKLAEAAEHFERALMLNPELEPLYYDLAGIKINMEKPKEALGYLEKARDKFKLTFNLEFYTAIAYGMLEDYSSALKHFISAEVLAKASDPTRLNHVFYYQLGSAYERNGQHAQAEEVFRKCLEISPDYTAALNYLGYMWAEVGKNLDEAHSMIEKAVKLEPENAAYLDSLAWVLYKLNRHQEALEWMQKAIQYSEEPDATLYDHLGDIYAALNRMDKAREAWKKSLALKPDEKVQKKMDQSSGINQ